MLDALRVGAQRLQSDLGQLGVNFAAVGEAASPRPPFEPESDQSGAEPDQSGAAPDSGEGGSAEPAASPEQPAPALVEREAPVEAVTATAAVQPATPTSAQTPAEPGRVGAGAAGGTAEDAEGARLIALNMALNGTPRDETDRYLADNFELSDRASLLDEVYASVDG
jgi:hypothetical protein